MPTPQFYLIDSDTNAEIREIFNGDVIDLAQTPKVNIRAKLTPSQSMRFWMDDVLVRTDNDGPYAMFGETGGDYAQWMNPPPGPHTIKATAYSMDNAGGTALGTVTRTITVKAVVQPPPPPPGTGGLPDLTTAYLASLPRSGSAHSTVVSAANSSTRPNLADQNSKGNTNALARAILGRTSDAAADIGAAVGSLGGVQDTLCLSRELAPLPLVSRLAGRNDSAFFMSAINKSGLKARGIGDSLHENALADPVNWGTMARGSLMAVGWYVGGALLDEAYDALKRYLEGGSEGFTYKSDQVSWGRWTIAPKGTTKNGVDLDGAIHDIYRGGDFPTIGADGRNYIWEATQGTIVAAIYADMAGHPEVWEIGDRAILRSIEWMYRFVKEPPSGDDRWIPWVIKRAYGSAFTRPLESTSAGKNWGWTDWLYG